VERRTGLGALGLPDVWEARELLFFLAWRDIKVRYKQTALGAAWAILQPFLLMVVFSVFLGHFAGVKSTSDIPYPIFTYTALIPWTLFAQSLNGASQSLVQNSALISKIYFPRLLLPLSAAGSFAVDFGAALLILAGMMAFYGVGPGVAVVALPVLALFALLAAVSVGILLSAVNVRYRDVQYAVPFLIQLWLFVTPVAYSADVLPHAWRLVYAINPMVGVVEGFRWALLSSVEAPVGMMAVSAGSTMVLLLLGLVYFRRTERTFADVI
jgi:lipopolysaccharide transport system permease protein